jgi:hypothetical protein
MSKLARCIVRTLGALAILALAIWAAKYLELDYEDARALLGIVNAYLPELVAIGLGTGVGVVFYRASVSEENEFSFVNFFMAGKREDLWRFGYFVLLVTAVWVIFTMVWRDRLDAAMMGVILGAFIAKNMIDTAGKAWGSNPPPADPANLTETKP